MTRHGSKPDRSGNHQQRWIRGFTEGKSAVFAQSAQSAAHIDIAVLQSPRHNG
jgi:hypothetical protein